MNKTLILSISLFGAGAGAQEIRENYNGVRSLGMGGASIAVVNDETALLLNPAALGKLSDPEIETLTDVFLSTALDVF